MVFIGKESLQKEEKKNFSLSLKIPLQFKERTKGEGDQGRNVNSDLVGGVMKCFLHFIFCWVW
jgi:hypothetical protein